MIVVSRIFSNKCKKSLYKDEMPDMKQKIISGIFIGQSLSAIIRLTFSI